MSQIHRALSHYWNLRDQGLAPSAARAHVRSRFGVEVDHEQPLASTSAVVEQEAPRIEKPEITVASNPQGLFGTTTGRISCAKPNLGSTVRRVKVRPGVSIAYSGMEGELIGPAPEGGGFDVVVNIGGRDALFHRNELEPSDG